jgi:hypothetical protein
MSKAALLIRDFGPQKVEAISELRKELGVSMSDINRVSYLIVQVRSFRGSSCV